MIEAGKQLGDTLIVIVKNDKQQLIKKGKVILTEKDRARMVGALRDVDVAVIAIDEDDTVRKTLEKIVSMYPGNEFIFANGGYSSFEKVTPETEVCQKHGIKMMLGVGGTDKTDSSTRINLAKGDESPE